MLYPVSCEDRLWTWHSMPHISDMGFACCSISECCKPVRYYYWKRTIHHAAYYTLARYFKNGGTWLRACPKIDRRIARECLFKVWLTTESSIFQLSKES